ncbi:hypothetical protein AWV80_02760 [Cupriavidus sp. UYMU48A]|nr:hypothetical protein AWV80_02760 [Cupriavidus sp. UYMU48A]
MPMRRATGCFATGPFASMAQTFATAKAQSRWNTTAAMFAAIGRVSDRRNVGAFNSFLDRLNRS